MNAKENALRIIRFDNPKRIVTGCPTHGIAYCEPRNNPEEVVA